MLSTLGPGAGIKNFCFSAARRFHWVAILGKWWHVFQPFCRWVDIWGAQFQGSWGLSWSPLVWRLKEKPWQTLPHSLAKGRCCDLCPVGWLLSLSFSPLVKSRCWTHVLSARPLSVSPCLWKTGTDLCPVRQLLSLSLLLQKADTGPASNQLTVLSLSSCEKQMMLDLCPIHQLCYLLLSLSVTAFLLQKADISSAGPASPFSVASPLFF